MEISQSTSSQVQLAVSSLDPFSSEEWKRILSFPVGVSVSILAPIIVEFRRKYNYLTYADIQKHFDQANAQIQLIAEDPNTSAYNRGCVAMNFRTMKPTTYFVTISTKRKENVLIEFPIMKNPEENFKRLETAGDAMMPDSVNQWVFYFSHNEGVFEIYKKDVLMKGALKKMKKQGIPVKTHIILH